MPTKLIADILILLRSRPSPLRRFWNIEQCGNNKLYDILCAGQIDQPGSSRKF
jgi:hypothetical protein